MGEAVELQHAQQAAHQLVERRPAQAAHAADEVQRLVRAEPLEALRLLLLETDVRAELGRRVLAEAVPVQVQLHAASDFLQRPQGGNFPPARVPLP